MDVVHSENLFPAEEKAKRRSLSSTFREECTTVSEEDVLFAGEGRDDCLETPEREEALPFEQRDENKENNCQDGENNCQSNYQDNCQSGSGLAAPPDSPTLSGAQPVGIPELAKPQKQTRLSNFFSFVVKPAAPTQPSAGGAKAEKEKPGSSQEKRTKKIDASKAAQNKLPFIAEQAARREAVEASTPPSTSSVPCASAPSALVLLPLCASHTPAAESFVSPSSSFVSAEACAAADAGGKTGRGDAALRSDEVSEGQPSSCVGSAEAQETDTLEVSAAEATDEAERPAAREERGSRGELEGTAVGAELPTERGERREERTQLEATQHTRGREGADDCGAEGYEQTPPSLSAERAASDPDEALMHASPARRTSLRLAASAVPASPSMAPVSPTPPCAASASPASPSSLSSSRCLSSSPSDSERAAAASQPASLLPALDAAAAEDARAIALEEVEGEDACGREPGEKENDDDCILEREDTDKTRGRGSAALREAWSAIFRRSSKQGDGEARDKLTSPSEEPKRRQSSSAVKRETGRERLHSREKEGEAIAPSAPVEAEAEAKQELENKPTPRVERGGRGGRRARGRRSTDALGILPVPAQRKGEERGNTPVEDSERREEPVEEAGRRRSKRVLECQQRRPLSDAEPVAVSVSESEEEERKAGNSEAEEAEDEAKQKRRCSARSLLPGAFPSTTSGVRGKRGRPKKRARVEAVPKQKDEKWDFFASKEERRQRQEEEARKRRQQEAERKKQEDEERRQREAFEAMMQRRRVILQEQQMQREREDEQRVRLLVERNAAWLASLKAFEEADALDERPQHRFPDIAAPKSLETHGVQADVRASRLEEDLLRQKSAARRVERSDAEGGEAEVAPRGTERKRRRCVAFSDEEADERVEPVVATGEAPRNEEEEEAAQRSADGRREGTAASREAPSVAAAAAQGKRFSPSSLRAAHAPPPQLAACGWAEVREKFLQLCGLAGFRARDATFFVADGPFTFYTRKGILNLLQKAGLQVTISARRATCILTNDAGYWPQEKTSQPRADAASASPFSASSSLDASASGEGREPSSDEAQDVEDLAAASSPPSSVSAAREPCSDREKTSFSFASASGSSSRPGVSAFFEALPVATESMLMRAMGASVEEAARRFSPVNGKCGFLVQEIVDASLQVYSRKRVFSESATVGEETPRRPSTSPDAAGVQEGAREGEKSRTASPVATLAGDAEERQQDVRDPEGEGGERERRRQEGSRGATTRRQVDREEREMTSDDQPESSQTDSEMKSEGLLAASEAPGQRRENPTIHAASDIEALRQSQRGETPEAQTSAPDPAGDDWRGEGEWDFRYLSPDKAGVLKAPPILWLSHLTEMWPRAFEASCLSELAGNNDALLELCGLLETALRPARDRCDEGSTLGAGAASAKKPRNAFSLLMNRQKKGDADGGGAGRRVAPARRREEEKQRQREEDRPRVIVVSMPPACGGDRLLDLLCYAFGYQAVREHKLREEKRIDGLFLSMAMVSAQARASQQRHQAEQAQADAAAVVISDEEKATADPSTVSSAKPCSKLRAETPPLASKAPRAAAFGEASSQAHAGREDGGKTPLRGLGEETGDVATGHVPSLPLPRLSVYDWWSLCKTDQKKLLQRKPRKQAPGRGEERTRSPPILCVARWREGEDECAAREAVNAAIDDALSVSVGRGKRGGGSDEDDDEFRDTEALRRGIRIVGLLPPPKEALVQRVLAIATAAVGAPVDRALVELLFASSGNGHQAPGSAEAAALSGILHTLHLITRTHANSRLLHAAYQYETQRQAEVQHRELASCSPSAARLSSPEEGSVPCPQQRGGSPLSLPPVSWYEAEPDYCRREDSGDAGGGSARDASSAHSTQSRLARIVQNFVLPPLERPLPLPFALAEAPLLAFWRLQQEQPISLLLQLFGSRNALAADSLAALMHALDLLHEKFAHSQRTAFLRHRQSGETLAEVADRHGNLEALLDAFRVCARAVKLENECSGCLVLDAPDCAPAAGKASAAAGGKLQGDESSAGNCGGGVSSAGVAREAVLKENVESALLRGIPLRIGALLPETTAHFVGELVLGGVALLQHGPKGTYEPPPLGCSIEAVRKQFLTEKMIRQEKLQTRRKLEKLGESSMRVLELRRVVEDAGSLIDFDIDRRAPSVSTLSDSTETRESDERDAGVSAERTRSFDKKLLPPVPPREGYRADSSHLGSDSEDSDGWMEDDVSLFEIMSVSTMLRCAEPLRRTFLTEGRLLENLASSRSKGGRRARAFKKRASAFPDDAKLAKVAASLRDFQAEHQSRLSMKV